ncbi:MAG TPA: ribbon-helix-helix domain-containing protein [Azospirillum sp.]|nr:ribbon-helix-helix domain-containing protein [Azospirillum sp.]
MSRSVKIAGQSRQLRIEPSYWEALEEIGQREGLSVDELCTDLKERLDAQSRRSASGVSLANAVRVFIVGYFRQAATEMGHSRAGHGRGDPLASTPFDTTS